MGYMALSQLQVMGIDSGLSLCMHGERSLGWRIPSIRGNNHLGHPGHGGAFPGNFLVRSWE